MRVYLIYVRCADGDTALNASGIMINIFLIEGGTVLLPVWILK